MDKFIQSYKKNFGIAEGQKIPKPNFDSIKPAVIPQSKFEKLIENAQPYVEQASASSVPGASYHCPASMKEWMKSYRRNFRISSK